MANSTAVFNRDIVKTQIATVDSTYAVDPDDTHVFGATAGGAFTATLPLAAAVRPGKEIVFKKTDASANDFTVARAGADTIDGATSKVLGAQYDYMRLVSDGATKWHIIGAVLNA